VCVYTYIESRYEVMSERSRRKKQIYPEDISVFEGIQKKDAKVLEVSLQQALETLQKLGFKVSPPSTIQDIQAHEDSVDLLGITKEPVKVSRSRKKSKQVVEDTKLRGRLYFAHHVSGETYGPGDIELEIEQRDLYVSLLKQDQTCLQHYQEPLLPQSSRCYIVQKGALISRNNYMKKEVTEAQFNSAALWDGFLTETAGAQDLQSRGIAVPTNVGYHVVNNTLF